MWIKEPPSQLSPSSDENLNFLYNSGKYYIMDNHLAAAWCWLQKIDISNSYNLYHIDRHFDLIDCPSCVRTQIIEAGIDLSAISLDEYLNIKFGANSNRPLFRFDNYIKNLKEVYSTVYNKKFFSTHRDGDNEDFLSSDNGDFEKEIFQIIHEIGDDILDTPSNSWIVNIDIDYFFLDDNRGNYYQFLSDKYIKTLFNHIKDSIDNIAVVTISISPESSGGWNASLRVARMIAKLLEIDFRYYA